MWNKLFFKGKKSWRFEKAELAESTEDFLAPARGWYSLFPFSLDKSWNPETLVWSLRADQSLVLVLVDIGAAKGRALTSDELEDIRSVFRFFSSHQKDMILRIVYDTQGKGMEREPYALSRIEQHILQLSPIFREFQEHIFVFQGAMVGSWGEMHGSKFLSREHLQRVFSSLAPSFEEHTWLAVRTPRFWRLINDSQQWSRSLPKKDELQDIARFSMGLYDDAIFASADDLGTFGVVSASEADWAAMWKREDELDFERELTAFAPHGGEAVLGSEEHLPISDTVDRLRRMGITYLNSQYDEKLLNQWREEVWHSEDIWNGISAYEYISRHLGYRFVVKQADMVIASGKKQAQLSLALSNVGFAPIYQRAAIKIVMLSEEGIRTEYPLHEDLRLCRDKELHLRLQLPLQQGKLYLQLRREADGRLLPLANEQKEDTTEGLFLGCLRLER